MVAQTKTSILVFAAIATVAVFYLVASAVFPLAYSAEIGAAAERYGLEPALIRAVIWTESKYDEGAESEAGASGLMQLMPRTREWMAAEEGITADGSAASEIMIGCAYLKRLMSICESEEEALMSYNAGYANVIRWRRGGVPYPETEEYVRRVMFARKIYRLL